MSDLNLAILAIPALLAKSQYFVELCIMFSSCLAQRDNIRWLTLQIRCTGMWLLKFNANLKETA